MEGFVEREISAARRKELRLHARLETLEHAQFVCLRILRYIEPADLHRAIENELADVRIAHDDETFGEDLRGPVEREFLVEETLRRLEELRDNVFPEPEWRREQGT